MSKEDPSQFWKFWNTKTKRKENKINIESLFDFFKNLNSNPNSNEMDDFVIPESLDTNELDKSITKDEIIKAINKLKRRKAVGVDKIENEYLIETRDLLLNFHFELFNLILETGILPENWLIGIIKPIFKNQGEDTNPENYRPLTLLSCFGKLFTSIINVRLTKYIEDNDILNKVQAGFRKGYSTIDNMFVLHSIIDILKSSKKKLFCCFIDFRKAFDNVWRIGLWQKLVTYGITGKIMTLIKNMYSNIKSCISHNNNISGFFSCEKGVRQGENLSPLLFSLFLNDLETWLQYNNCQGITVMNIQSDIVLQNGLKLLLLLYADDTVLFSDNAIDLQYILNCFQKYCEDWKLEVNYKKTKILIFGSGNTKQNKFKFIINNVTIDIVDSYIYLGIKFNKNRKYTQAIKYLSEQASKATFCLLRKSRNINLPLDCLFKAYDHMIIPIITYGSEIWGYSNIDILERLQSNFIKICLKFKKVLLIICCMEKQVKCLFVYK